MPLLLHRCQLSSFSDYADDATQHVGVTHSWASSGETADEDAAVFVRGVNDGNETVPTVVVENTVRTNPEAGWVRRMLQEG
jgi:hypothetical protein